MKYFTPTSVSDAAALLESEPGSEPLAGGTDLIVGIRQGRRQFPDGLVALQDIRELKEHTIEEYTVTLGAGMSFLQLLQEEAITSEFAALADAAALIGSRATRGAGTIGGNIVNASPAMEMGAPFLVFSARLALQSTETVREMDLDEFISGPRTTILQKNELLTAVRLVRPNGRYGSAYVRLGYRAAMEIAVVGAATRLLLDEEGRLAECSVAVSAVAPRIELVPTPQGILGEFPHEELLACVASSAVEVARPIDDVRGSARYRLAMVPVVVRRSFEAALLRAGAERGQVGDSRWQPIRHK